MALAAAAIAGIACVRRSRRSGLLGLTAVGAALVLARAGAGLAIAPNSAGDPVVLSGSHVAHVLSVGSTDGAQQRVVLELEPPSAPDRVYAWLPRYPAVNALDRISF